MVDTATWRQLSPLSVVFILAKGAIRILRENLPLLVGIGAGVALLERIGARELALAGAGIAALAAVGAVVYYRRFRYRLEGDVLRVRRGVFEIREVELRADRIQHIRLREPLAMRIFGLAVVEVSTPGGGDRDLDLPGLRRETARELTRRLVALRGESAPASPDDRAAASDVRFRATGAGITLHGAASQSILVAAAAVAPLLAQLAQHLEGDTARLVGRAFRNLGERLGSDVIAGLIVALAALLLLSAGSIATAWIRYGGYELSREGDQYGQQSGLLSRQQQSLALPRLQAVEWVETAVGRMLGRSYLVCRQIGAATDPNESRGAFVIPALDRREAARLIGEMWPAVATDASLARPHPAYRRLLMLRGAAALIPLFGLAAAVTGDLRWLLGIAASPLALWPLAYSRWRAVGYRADGDAVWVRRGLLGRRSVIAPPAHAQRVTVRQSWFQRRRRLATLVVTLAHGPVSIPYVPESSARSIADLILYSVETGPARRERGFEAG